MRKNFISCSIIILMMTAVIGCNKDSSGSPDSRESTGTASENGHAPNPDQPGVITSGEWNDLNNWNFWKNLLEKEEFKSFPSYWSFFHHHRISVQLTTDGTKPAIDAIIQLKRGGTTIFTARTDNKGKAELWVDLLQASTALDYAQLTLDINSGEKIISNIIPYESGVNAIVINSSTLSTDVDIALVVDATGSMGDELEFLKTELVDVLSRVKQANPNTKVSTSSVFYRDEGDAYVTRLSEFTDNNSMTIDFIKAQRAEGGGDFPEAVHTALERAIQELQWSSQARARVLFLLLDAPPHHNITVIQSLQTQIKEAAAKGIKIIPITASGIDKSTELLMRFFALSTNGTYVFITDHSGVGNPHIEASVGDYKVEFLNDLMVRLINSYVE